MPETTEERWLVCPDTMHLLTRLDPVMRLAIEADDLQLRTMALHLLARGGKRLRPSLLFLASTFGTASPERLLRAAAALELLHVASLYHDDLMDRAVARRNADLALVHGQRMIRSSTSGLRSQAHIQFPGKGQLAAERSCSQR